MAENLSNRASQGRELSRGFRSRINWRTDALLILMLGLVASMVALSPNSTFRSANAAPLSLTFESTPAAEASLGVLASRSKCGLLSKQGVGPYTMTGTDSRSGSQYSYVTDRIYSGATQRESAIASSSGMSYSNTPGFTYGNKSNVLKLSSSGNISWTNTCNGNDVYGSIFGPEVYTAAFQATAGQALSFNWAAAGGGDDYEVYAFLVKVSPISGSYDYGGTGSTLASNSTLLTHGRGRTQGWTTSTGSIPSDGFYRFRFVNGTYDFSGGWGVGATMYVDPNVLVGEANNISFGVLSDRVTSSSSQTFSISASATSGGAVIFSSSTTSRCTVGSSTTSGGISTATLTVLANQTGLCTITANSASVGDYATAASVSRSFTILGAPTAPTNSGGTSVSGTAAVGQTLTANDGSWADGGSAITGTSYQWQVCPNPASCSWSHIAGASGSTYEVGATDGGKQLRVVVTKTNGIGSTSATSPATATVAKGSQAPLTVSTTTVTYGTTLSLATSGGSGTGAVSYAVVSGTCTISGSTLTPGVVGSSCVVRATKAADTSYNAATSPDTTISVTRANQAGLSVTSTLGTVGVALTLTTSGGSGTGAVSYAVVSGSCSVSGSTLTSTTAGSTCVVKATKAADTNYSATSSADTTVVFAKGSQTSLVISSVSAIFGIALNLTTSGGSGTGAVSYAVSSGSCSVLGSILTVGDAGSACNVVATKAGDDNYNAVSSASTSIATLKASQDALTVTSTNAIYGQAMALTSSGGSGTGAVSYSVVSGTCSISGSLLTPGSAGSSCVVKATKVTDTNYNEVSSANTTITIAKANQATLTLTSTSGTFGVDLALTTSGGSGAGAVSYAVVSGACSVNGSTLTASAAGSTCVVKATKATDTNYEAASSADTTVVFAKGSQAALTVSTTSATFGFTLTLGTSGGSGTGGVTYAVSEGSCFVIGSLLTVGNAGSTCEVVATKASDDNYNEVSSMSTAITTLKAAQAALTVSTTSATYGQTLTLASSGGSGTGVVSFVVVSGTCSISGSSLSPGDAGSSCVVKATKATDTNYNERSSANTTITIGKANQATLTLTSTSGTFGVDLALTTSGGSGAGAVSYAVVSGACSVNGSTLTASAAGSTCVVKATKATDTNYEAASSADTTVVFAKGTQASLAVTSVSTVFGIALSLSTSGGSGTGEVSYAVSSGSCSVLGAILTTGDAGSSCDVIATKAEDDNYNSISSAATSISTMKAAQSALTISTRSATYGQELTMVTTGGSGLGAVSYAVVSGACSISGSSLTPGNAGSSCVVKATKATDTNYNERSSANTTITIGKANQTGLRVTSDTSFTTGSPLTLTAAGGQSTGVLSWSLESGACSLAGSTLTANRGGISCVVEVTRAGDSNYVAESVTETITVSKISQLLTFRSTPPASPVVGGTYTVTVESDVSLAPTIVIANSSASVCSIAAGVVTFNAVGTCLISASQPGSDVYASAAASQSVSVAAVPVTTTVPPASNSASPASMTGATTTVPQSAVAAASSSTTVPATTTTTTTTTTVPADPSKPILGADGQPVELAEGETTVLIRGEPVVVNTRQEDGQLIMELPNNVVVRIGAKGAGGTTTQVGTDGVLRAYRNSEVEVELTGLVPGTTYTIFMFSTPVELGRGSVSADGAVSQIVKLPSAAEIGSHTLQVNGVGPGGEVVSVSMGMKVEKKQSNTAAAVVAISAAILLALLGGRPIFTGRRRRRLRDA